MNQKFDTKNMYRPKAQLMWLSPATNHRICMGETIVIKIGIGIGIEIHFRGNYSIGLNRSKSITNWFS